MSRASPKSPMAIITLRTKRWRHQISGPNRHQHTALIEGSAAAVGAFRFVPDLSVLERTHQPTRLHGQASGDRLGRRLRVTWLAWMAGACGSGHPNEVIEYRLREFTLDRLGSERRFSAKPSRRGAEGWAFELKRLRRSTRGLFDDLSSPDPEGFQGSST
jgi:hypothetical protein